MSVATYKSMTAEHGWGYMLRADFFGLVTQLIECFNGIEDVAGLSPVGSTIFSLTSRPRRVLLIP